MRYIPTGIATVISLYRVVFAPGNSVTTSTGERPDMSDYPQLKLYIGGGWRLPALVAHVARETGGHHPEGRSDYAWTGRGDGGCDDPGAGETDRAVPAGDPARLRNHRMGRAGRPSGLWPHHP